MIAQHVLISPLDWGLGHATRCIPIIQYLRNRNTQVTIAGNGASLQLLKQEFPDLLFLEIPSFEINYGRYFNLAMIKQMPKFLKLIQKETECVSQWLKQYDFDLIISDNRYGFRHPKVRSILVSHQLSPKFPKGLGLANQMVQKQLNRWMNAFDEIWVPDFDHAQNLSGSLSINDHLIPPISFIGPLSRFSFQSSKEPILEIAAVISGPEPSRSQFEEQVIKTLKRFDVPAALVRGLPNEVDVPDLGDQIQVFNHLTALALRDLLMNSRMVISRSGYSTIMDLYCLNKCAILIPTPGQSEQDYLAKRLTDRGCWNFTEADSIDWPDQKLELPQDVIVLNQASYTHFETRL